MLHSDKTKKSKSVDLDSLAESQGFEPWVSFPTQHFECCTFDHSDNSPYIKLSSFRQLRYFIKKI